VERVEDNMIKLNHKCKICTFFWYLLHMYIIMHGSKNVKFISPSKTDWSSLEVKRYNVHQDDHICSPTDHTII